MMEKLTLVFMSNCSLFLQVWSLLLLTLFLKAVVLFEATFVRKIELKLSLLFFVLLSNLYVEAAQFTENLSQDKSRQLLSWELSSKC